MIFCLILITLTACSRGNDSPPTVVTAISAGNLHTVALKNDGTVLAWGYNGYGQLGYVTTSTYSNIPEPVGGTLLTGVIKISAGGYRTVALKNDGTVWDWGYNLHGELGDGSGIKLGDGTVTYTNKNTPVQVEGLTGITAISAGNLHTVALKNDGTVTVWAWGNNYYGQLGDGTIINKNTPVQVSDLTGIITAISAGGNHTVALKNDGTVTTVWAWGLNSSGQLGDGTTDSKKTPVQVSDLTGIVMAISAGGSHTVALKNDGTVWAWGSNDYGQLGDGTTAESHIPVQVGGSSPLTHVIAISAGNMHTVALKDDGTVWAWGNNSYGKLGDGTTTESHIPVQVSDLTGVIKIAAGESHTVALQSDGTLWAWGKNNDYGQLGDGTMADSYTPVKVK